ncbi:MAG: histidine phosphatase family protein [Aquificota bacterium]|nr:histidine phosphatase family protein [Aquificota bacterium]
MKRFYLVRHAQSELNEKGVFQGRLDSDLTPLGFVQARLVAGFLKDKGIKRIVSSPQRRAYKTALIIGDVLSLEVDLDDRLREMSFGDLEGKSFWDLMEREREMIVSWLKDPVRFPLPTQEPVEAFEKRVSSFVEDMVSWEEDTVAVIAHGGTLHAIVCLTTGLDLSRLWRIHMDNASITLLEFDGSFRIAYLNRKCHLI